MTVKLKHKQDFNELLDLKDLMNNFKIYDNLKNNLDSYIESYFKSFFKTKDEVLEYIPKSSQQEYKKYLMFSGIVISDIQSMSFSTYLDHVMDKYLQNDPYYIVDTINKRILPVLSGNTIFKIDKEKNELSIKRIQFKKGIHSWDDGDVNREYIFDTNNNTLKLITGSWH